MTHVQFQLQHLINLISFYERDIDGYYLVVQEERKLSDYIAEKTNVKHESPQAFYFVDGKAVWNASHSDINVSTLAQAEE